MRASLALYQQVDWMDEETRAAALDKADAMSSFIAYPDELLDDRKLSDFYESLQIAPGNYLESVLNLTLFATEYSLNQLRLPVNKSDWVTYGDSAIVNAYYSPNDNSMRTFIVRISFRLVQLLLWSTRARESGENVSFDGGCMNHTL